MMPRLHTSSFPSQRFLYPRGLHGAARPFQFFMHEDGKVGVEEGETAFLAEFDLLYHLLPHLSGGHV